METGDRHTPKETGKTSLPDGAPLAPKDGPTQGIGALRTASENPLGHGPIPDLVPSAPGTYSTDCPPGMTPRVLYEAGLKMAAIEARKAARR